MCCVATTHSLSLALANAFPLWYLCTSPPPPQRADDNVREKLSNYVKEARNADIENVRLGAKVFKSVYQTKTADEFKVLDIMTSSDLVPVLTPSATHPRKLSRACWEARH